MTDIDHTTDPALDALRASLLEIDADDASLDRMRTALRNGVTDTAHVRPRRPRRRRVVLALVVAVAAAVSAGVALLPSASAPSGHRGIGPRSAAAEALQGAGSRAAAQAWLKLRPGEYFHTYFMSFQPEVPSTREDPIDGTFAYDIPGTGELWIDRSGHGANVQVGGAQTLKHGPTVSRNRAGKIVGSGGLTVLENGVSIEQSLAHAWEVGYLAWPRGSKPSFQRAWLRVGHDFEKTADFVMVPTGKPHDLGSPDEMTRIAWGASIEEIEALPASGPSLDAAIVELINDDSGQLAMFGPVPTGSNGVTVATRRSEAGIEHATQLLGGAPLPPAARRAIYRWLAAQPGAHLDGPVTDELGRRGTSITFTRVHAKDVPARDVTAQQLIEAARAAGTDLPDTTSRKTWHVAAHREYRRWIANIVFDPQSANLLQSWSYSKQKFPVEVPQLLLNEGDPHPEFRVEGGNDTTFGGVANGRIWVSRDRVMSMEPRSPICADAPKTCR
ncbi:MAG: hypothetical protein JWN72_466 [Thermoleophilia bacterium]|nr:hypothetical protein [Thermoleophilia bacterium]